MAGHSLFHSSFSRLFNPIPTMSEILYWNKITGVSFPVLCRVPLSSDLIRYSVNEGNWQNHHYGSATKTFKVAHTKTHRLTCHELLPFPHTPVIIFRISSLMLSSHVFLGLRNEHKKLHQPQKNVVTCTLSPCFPHHGYMLRPTVICLVVWSCSWYSIIKSSMNCLNIISTKLARRLVRP
jgi:hypothetical protein